jgi:hypothetical protein
MILFMKCCRGTIIGAVPRGMEKRSKGELGCAE